MDRAENRVPTGWNTLARKEVELSWLMWSIMRLPNPDSE